MKYAFNVGLLVILLVGWVNGQENPGLGFFQEDAPELAVKGFVLASDHGSWSMNCYVAWDRDSKHAVVVDPGIPSQDVVAFIRAEDLKLQAILITHGHSDHVGGVAFLVARFPVPVYLQRHDHALATRTTGAGIAFKDFPGNGRLQAGELAFEVIPTPGHSPGSVCFKSGGILFSGDTLFAGTVGKAHGSSPKEREDNLGREIENIRCKLLILPPMTRVHPGHGSSTSIGREKAFNRFLK